MNEQTPQSAAEELRECPFCGSSEVRLRKPTCTRQSKYNPDDRAFPIASCGSCYAQTWGKDWDQSGATAVAAWNQRAVSEAAPELLAALKDFEDSAAKIGNVSNPLLSEKTREPWLGDWIRCLRNARAAIARAEGRA